jgi:hypothetical protein
MKIFPERPTLKRLLAHFQQNDVSINLWSATFLRLVIGIARSLSDNIDLDTHRFISANRLRVKKRESDTLHSNPLEEKISIAIVAAEKDFELLTKCIYFAKKSLDDYYSGFTYVVVPRLQVNPCKLIIQKYKFNDVLVISEDEFISETEALKLRQKFGSRFGWALQQILKLGQVLNSCTSYTLVVDCDTLLLQRRNWISNRKQILFPSWEYNQPYYDLLSRFGISNRFPDFTFVTHHMLMKKEWLIEALSYINLSSLADVVTFVISNSTEGPSPFCIEYELYGQYLYNFKSDCFFVEKWSNTSVLRKDIENCTNKEIAMKYGKFASISAHSFLN